ncbi:carbohydrate ABC transporter substrate-binding protein, CUT1 family [Streptomyces sp. DvalAA-14]|uniref:ABC transporter substrate-binding protein n=1 Tax=unclassified Streptomyces TaxID=2593676 RepID=UPI00081B889B|nr:MULTISPECIES: extracellular solute-binding protein [unclassified Streptomyces]MYS22763.1 extracellular solute-binding protein [Streptomyces sp. SID4948]SCE22126.1 carbohydrate ABC transporter substrate-binding protein, CUT1 family [Streptomyces sp. DvalAA-14]
MRMWSLSGRSLAAGMAAALGIGLLAGCSAQGSTPRTGNTITVWSEENLPPRMAVTQKLINTFEKQTGIKVNLVGVDESQLPQLVESAAAAGKLPDVMGGIPLAPIWQMYSNGLINTDATAKVLNSLGRSTFSPNALNLTSDGSKALSVPSDSWQQILVYRKDLFAKAHLPVPDTYANILKAAQTLDKGSMTGISVADDPTDVFTQQSFEDFAVANNCQLVDSAGKVSLDSPQCEHAFAAYQQLAASGPAGTQTVDTTRATYQAGQSAMVVWSTYLLNSLAGLRNDVLPNCPQCKADKSFLTKNSGIVTAIKGPDGTEPAQFGEISSWTITKYANAPDAEKFVQFMMSGGYEGWLGMEPEGKIPVRSGTTADPQKYVTDWRAMKIGVDTVEPMNKLFSAAFLDQLLAGVGKMQRWGITQGQGALVGATEGTLPVPKAIGSMTGGDNLSPSDAAHQAKDAVGALKKTLL